MAIQLEPIELDISEALNDIDKLKEHIEDAFRSHGASNDPRMERLLMQLRSAYDTLDELQERMENIHFDPSVEYTLEAVRNHINELQSPLQQARENVVALQQAFQNMNFDPDLDSKIQSLGVGIYNINEQLDACHERIAGLIPSEEASQKYEAIQQQIEGVKDKLAEAQERMGNLADKIEPHTDWTDPQGNAKAYLEEQANISALQKELQSLISTKNELIQQNPNLSATASQQLEQERQNAQALEQALQEVRERRAELQSQAAVRDSMTTQIEQAQQVVQSYEGELQNLIQEEQALQGQLDRQNNLADEYQRAADSVTILQQRLGQLSPEIERPNRLLTGMQHLLQSLQSILMSIGSAVKAVFSKIGQLASEIASKIKSALSSLLSHVKSIASHIGSSLSSKFKSLGKSASGMTNSLEGGFKKAFKMLLKYGLGVRSLFFLFRKLRAAAIASLGEMAKQIPEVNKQMSSLKQSMNQMKGSLGTMIQPLLNILVPVLQKVAQLVTALTEKIASFFALLTGQKYIYTATAGAVDYAASLDKTGKSAKKAKKELQGYLSPIDEINKYQEKNKDEDDSGSGAGGDLTYAKKAISKDMEDFFNWLKDMWAKGDFTELGKWLSDKLAEALGSIDWVKVKAMARKLGSSLATLINGFLLGEFDGKSTAYWIGHTVAESINTAFEFINEFVHKLNWRGIGKFIADAFNALFDGIDWELIYDTVITGLRGIGEAIWQFITEFKWDNIYNFIKNAIHTIADGIKALFTAEGYDDRGFKQNGTWVQRLAKELGAQFRQIITDPELMSDIGETIGILIKNIYDFIVNFITEAFSNKEGISEGIRGFIEGILTGLGLSDSEIEGAMSWVDTIGGYIDRFITWLSGIDWGGVWDTIVNTVTTVWNTLHDIWIAAEPVLQDIWKAIQPLLEDMGKRLVKFLQDLPGYLEELRNSDEFKTFLDWLSNLKWEDIKQGLSDLADGLKTVGKVILGLKGFMVAASLISAIGKAASGLSKIKGLFSAGKGVAEMAADTSFQDIQILDPDTLAPMSTKKTLATRISEIIKGAVQTVKTSFGAGGFMNTVLFGDIGANVAAGGATAGATIGAAIVGGIVAFFGGAELGKNIGEWIFPDDSELYESYSGITGTFEMLKDFFVSLKDFILMTWDDLGNGSTEKLAKAWEWILRIIMPFTNALFDIVNSLQDKINEVTAKIKETVIEKFNTLKQKFDDFKAKAIEFKDAVVNKFNELKDGLNEKIENIKQKFEDFKTSLVAKWDAVKQKLEEFKNNFIEKCTNIKEKALEFKDNLQEIWENIKTKVAEFVTHVGEKFDAFKEKIETFKTEAQKKFEDIKQNFIKVFEDIKNGIKEPINGIIGFIENFINKVIDGFNGLGDKLGSLDIDIPDWVPEFGGKQFKIGLPQLNHVSIPKLAQGAVIPPNKQFMAMLGDQKQGTNIETPLETMVDAFNQALQMNGGNGGQSITLNLMLPDKRTIAQYAIEGGQVLQMSRGRNPFLLERG